MSVSLRCQGFTLIEIIIVMLLSGLIAGLVSPGIIKSMNRADIKQTVKSLVSDLRYTRAQAIIKNKEQRILFNLSNKTYTTPKINKAITIPEGVTVKVQTAQSEIDGEYSAGIRFFTDGGSTGGNVTLIANNKVWVININWLTGDIDVTYQSHE